MPQDLAIVLLSGGMDSCVTAALAARQHELALLHVSYGQRTAERERRAFEQIADFYQITRRLVCSLDHLKAIGGSSLTDDTIPVADAALESPEIPASYVPFRNAHLLSIAVSWGEVIGARKIFIGAVEQDSSGYPDCRQAFYDAFQRAVELGTKPQTRLEIVTPLIRLRKSEIVRRGVELGAPFHLTWSCYRNSDVACGRCDSCVLRMRAFAQAGVKDPIPYVSDPGPGDST